MGGRPAGRVTVISGAASGTGAVHARAFVVDGGATGGRA